MDLGVDCTNGMAIMNLNCENVVFSKQRKILSSKGV
jgi:hypothetical protein